MGAFNSFSHDSIRHVAYVDLGARLYEILVVPGPVMRGGQRWDVYIDHARQAILIGDHLSHVNRLAAAHQSVTRLSGGDVLLDLPFEALAS